MYLGYTPYTVAGELKPTVKLTPLSGVSRPALGQVPVVMLKDQDATFGEKLVAMLPFAIAIVGASVVSGLIVHHLTKPSRRRG
jgi:hypothetical protein